MYTNPNLNAGGLSVSGQFMPNPSGHMASRRSLHQDKW